MCAAQAGGGIARRIAALPLAVGAVVAARPSPGDWLGEPGASGPRAARFAVAGALVAPQAHGRTAPCRGEAVDQQRRSTLACTRVNRPADILRHRRVQRARDEARTVGPCIVERSPFYTTPV
eukprot:2787130-Pyramimonas_sp.AAC.1